MHSQEESFSVVRDYLGLDRRILWRFIALVAGACAAVTILYVAIFGFDTWTTNMKRAGAMMVINLTAPTKSTATQYLCPHCGAVGLPVWGPDGTPLCPRCKTTMTAAVSAASGM